MLYVGNKTTCFKKVLTSGRLFNFHPEHEIISPCSATEAITRQNKINALRVSISSYSLRMDK